MEVYRNVGDWLPQSLLLFQKCEFSMLCMSTHVYRYAFWAFAVCQVAPLDPLGGMRAAVTRKLSHWRNPVLAEERISVEQAMRGYGACVDVEISESDPRYVLDAE